MPEDTHYDCIMPSRSERDLSRTAAYRIVPLTAVFLLMAASFYFFFSTFGSESSAARLNGGIQSLFSQSFYLTFCFFFGLSGILLMIACVVPSQLIAGVAVFGALASYIPGEYSLPGMFQLKLCASSAMLLVAGLRIRKPINGFATAILYAILVRLLFPHAMLGESLLVPTSPPLALPEIAVLGVLLLVIAAASVFVRNFAEQSLLDRDTILHLNQSIMQISKVNQELQDIARRAGEEAAAIERNRISRDIHDISGYIFTNIISLMDAGISIGPRDQNKIEGIFQNARTQARDGLQETRRALRTLRGGGYGGPKGLLAIYRIKEVFEKITGVEVQIDAGNILPNYGDDIDRMIYRTVQEALTNSLRHGRATKVRISLRQDGQVLSLTVSDNGIGSKKIVKGIGLAGMEERIAPFGGTLETSNPAEGGFRLCIKLTIPREAAGETKSGNEEENQGTAGR